MALTHQLYHTDIKIGEDAQTKIDFETANEIHFDADNAERVKIDSTGLTVVSGSLETATIDYTDGDLAMTIADGGGVTFAQAVDLGANTLTTTGSLQVRTIDYSEGDLAITIADGGGVTFAQAVDLGSNTLTTTGSLQVRTIDYSDGDLAMTIADGGKVTFSAGFAVGSDAAGDILYHNGTSYIRLAKGAADTVLTMNDAANAPGWEAAAGGGDSHDFVADGAISDGDAVALTSAGKVKKAVSAVRADHVEFEAGTTRYEQSIYDTYRNRIVTSYRDDDDSNAGKVVVGTIAADSGSGHAITFASPSTFASATSTNGSIIFVDNTGGIRTDEADTRIVVFYVDGGNSNYGTAIVGAVQSDNSVTWGTEVVFESAHTQTIAPVYDPDTDRVVVFYQDVGNSGHGTVVVGTVDESDNSISFNTGGASVFSSANTYSWGRGATYDTTANKIVLAYQDDSAAIGKAVVATVTGASTNTVAFGTHVTFRAGGRAAEIAAVYDHTANKTVIAYRDQGDSDKGTAIVGTVSGTDISFGSAVVFHDADTPDNCVSAAYDDTVNKVFITYDKNGGGGTYTYVTITGTTPSFSDQFSFTTNSVVYTGPAYDPDQLCMAVTYRDSSDSNKGNAVVIDSVNQTNYLEWVGFASAAISDTATGTIDIVGTVNASQSSLTIGSTYYINNFGALTTTSQANREVGIAISATELLVTQGSIAS